MNKNTTILKILFFSILLSSCSVSKLLPEGEKLYTGSNLKVERPDAKVSGHLRRNLEAVIIPQPNTRILGFPWRAWFHLKFKTDKDRGFRNWLSNKIGKPPVLYEPGLTDQVLHLLENRAQNLGHFRARAQAAVNEKENEVSIDYRVDVDIPYRIDSLILQIRDAAIHNEVKALMPGSQIRPGDLFSLSKLKDERQRIEIALREKGYYYFNSSDLEFFADTLNTGDERKIELLLKLKNDVPAQHLKPQVLKTVNVYPDYKLNRTDSPENAQHQIEEINFFCSTCPLKKTTLLDAVPIRPGQLYQPSKHQITLERLSNLNTFKYIYLSYDTVPGSDSLLILNAYLSQRHRRTIEGEVGVSYNTGRYLGPEFNLQYTNRNLFRGAEYLILDGRYSLNIFLGPKEVATVPKWTELELSATLSIPRFWLPGRERLSRNLQYANTHFRLAMNSDNLGFRMANLAERINDLGLSSLQQQLDRDSSFTPPVAFSNFEFKYGYNWQKRSIVRQEANPVVLGFQTIGVEDPELFTLFRSFNTGSNSSLVRLEKMQLYSPDYIFLYDTRLGKLRSDNIFFRQRFSFNVNRVTPLSNDINTSSETSLFFQWESDFHYYHNFGKGRLLATRLRIYTGYPISRRAIIPYFDLYSVGGANSLRGFPPRGVGPGAISPDQEGDISIFSGFGNILLEVNVEFRRRIMAQFEVAPFIDLGNVWHYRTQSAAPDAEFALKSFLSELAVDAGIGLRYDLKFLVIRTDFAWPVTQPWLPKGDRLVIDRFFQGNWWWENLNFVLAFGYPF